uniref:Uncharacterized protein n=1 Tax=Acrobeloides nanus TaxID=290746 RepID=A0A914CEP1_9BILA
MSIIHSGFFILFLASSLSVRVFAVGLGAVNYNILIEVTNVIICIYTAVVALVFFRLRKRLATSMTRIVPIGEEADLYHKNIQNLWK